MLYSILEAKDVEKENEGNLPVAGDQRAEDRKVRLRPSKQKLPPKTSPIISCRRPIGSQVKVVSLLEMASGMFLEGAGTPKAIARVGPRLRS